MNKSRTKDKNLLKWSLFIFGLAFISRLIFILQFQQTLLFDNHIVDMLYHHQWAQAVSEGREYYPGPFFRAPLYPLFLGFVYKISSISSLFISIVQICMGSLSAVILFLIGFRTFNFKTGLLAGLLMAFCGSLIFFEGQLLGTTLAIFLNLLSLYFIIKALDSNKIYDYGFAGIFMGLSAITRPNILFFAIILILWLIWKNKAVLSKHYKNILFIMIGIIIPIIPVSIYNFSQSGELTMIGAYGGINLYIANHSQADGISPVLPGIRQDWWGGKEDTKRLAELETGHVMTDAELSNFWMNKTKREIIDDPIRFVKLLFKKTLLLFNGFELSNNFDFYFFAFQNPILKILLWRTIIFFPWGIILPLSIVGMISAFSYNHKVKIHLLFLLGYSISIILFLVSARYRLPLLPVLILFSSHGIFCLINLFKKSNKSKFMIYILVLSVSLFISNFDFYGYHNASYAQGYHAEASIYARKGMMPEAEKNYRLALLENPNLASTINDLSLLLISQNKPDEAIRLLENGIKSNRDNPMLRYNLGFAYLGNNKPDLAIPSLREFLLQMPNNLYGLNNIGLAFSRTNQADSAKLYFVKAIQFEPTFASAYYNLAFVYEQTGNIDTALYWYNRIINIVEIPAASSFEARQKVDELTN